VAPLHWPDHYLSLTNNVGLASPTCAELYLQVAYSMPVLLLHLTALPSSMNALDGPAGSTLWSIVAIGVLDRESRQSQFACDDSLRAHCMALSRLGHWIASVDNDNAHGMLAREPNESGRKSISPRTSQLGDRMKWVVGRKSGDCQHSKQATRSTNTNTLSSHSCWSICARPR
jgi:hypothetical protein